MSEKPVIILGAGATKACGGPLTDEILPAALNGETDYQTPVIDREDLLDYTGRFLADCFNVPSTRPVTRTDCPSLPRVLSMLRRSFDLNMPLGKWQGDELIKVKRAIEYSIFAVIEAALRRMPQPALTLHRDLLDGLYLRNVDFTVVSLNYDVIIDNTILALNESRANMCMPDYGVDLSTPPYIRSVMTRGTRGRLYKIHGSLNWLYCEKCHRLDLFISEGMRTLKALDELYNQLEEKGGYSCRGTPCRNKSCDGFVSPILVSPTFAKDYENPHIKRVWQQAESAMKQCDRAVFIGYSLPDDDVEVAMLLKRGLGHLTSDRITVVEYVPGDAEKSKGRMPLDQHPTGQHFRSIFGAGLDWHTTGFAGWLKEQQAANKFPFAPS